MLAVAATSATGKMTKSMVKECTSGLMAKSTEESFATVREKAKASSRGPMDQSTEESGATVRKKAKASTRGPMVVNTSASGLMITFTEKVLLNGQTVANILEDMRRANHMEQEFTSTLRKKRFTVNGWMAR